MIIKFLIYKSILWAKKEWDIREIGDDTNE